MAISAEESKPMIIEYLVDGFWVSLSKGAYFGKEEQSKFDKIQHYAVAILTILIRYSLNSVSRLLRPFPPIPQAASKAEKLIICR